MKNRIVAFLLAPLLMIGGVVGFGAAPAFAADAVETNRVVQLILKETNDFRAERGLPPLILNSALSKVASDWSQGQYDQGFMSHNPNYVAQSPAGWEAVGENVAYGYQPQSVTTAWRNSPGHYANMMGNFSDIGIGYYESNGDRYYTQNFGFYRTTPILPYPVTGLTTAGGQGAITVSWAAPSPQGNQRVTGYDIRLTDSNGQSTTVTAGNVTSTTISELTPGTTYTVAVRAVNPNGAGAYNLTSSATVAASAPVAPEVAVNPGTRSAELNLSGYNGGEPITSWTVAVEGREPFTTTTPTVALDGLNPNVYYQGTVTATNSVGTSAAAAFQFTTAATAPSEPLNVTAVLSGETGIDVTWDAVADNGGVQEIVYTVNIYDAETAERVIDETNVTEFSFSTDGLTKGRSYYAAVTAENYSGVSASVNSETVTVPFTIPSAPRGVTAELVDERVITVNWNVSADNGGQDALESTVFFYADGATTPAFSVTAAGGVQVVTVTAADGVQADTDYRARVTATNSAGESALSTLSNVVEVPRTPTAPDAPATVTVADVTVNEAEIRWTAPDFNGGSAITGYRVTVTNGSLTVVDENVDADTLSYALENLTRATDYVVQVAAINDRGTSQVTSDEFTTLLERPSVPRNVALTLTNPNSLKVSWTAPADNGGSTNLTYNVQLRDADGEVIETRNGTTGKSVSFTGLPLSTDYFVTVVASNGQLVSEAVNTDVVATATPPALAENVVVKNADDQTVNITWDAPQNTGTYPLSRYAVTLYEVTNAGEVAPVAQNVYVDAELGNFATVGGLKPGSVYVAYVETFSEISNGERAQSEPVTVPAIAPDAPENLTLGLPEATTVSVNWDAPVYDGGADITEYTVTIAESSNTDVTDVVTVADLTDLNALFTDLVPATEYTVTVTATNTAGTSQTVSKTISTNAVAPDAVEDLKAVYTGNPALNVTWTVPAYNGGAEVETYVVTIADAETGIVVDTVETALTSHLFTGLDRNANYNVTVTAVNTVGAGDTADVQNVNIPAVSPDAVENVEAGLTDATTVVVNWDAPVYDGGADVTGYVVSILNGNQTVDTLKTSQRSTSFTGLKPVTEYTVVVTAVNSAGESNTEATTITTGAVAPEAVQNVEASADENTVVVDWDAPVYDGGAAITGYVVNLIQNGEVVATETVTDETASFKNVDRGLVYTVAVQAVNTAGESETVTSSEVAVAAIAPDAATDVTASVQNRTEVNVTWDAPTYNGGSAVLDYTVVIFDADGEVVNQKTVPAGTLNVTFADFAPATEYDVVVTARNAVGSTESSVVAFTTDAVEPNAVTDVVANVKNRTVSAQWKAPAVNGGSAITSYSAALVNIATNAVIETVTVTETEATFTNVARGQEYRVEVTANNKVGASKVAVSENVQVVAVAPTSPVNAAAALTSPNSVVVTWEGATYNGGAEITEYAVVYTDGITTQTVTVPASARSVAITELAADTKYTFTVFAVNSAGLSLPTDVEGSFLTAPADAPVSPTEEVLTKAPVVEVVKNGNILTAKFSDLSFNNNWVYGYAFSEPVALGWANVDGDEVSFDISNAGLEAGTHTLAVLVADGTVIAAGEFSITAAPVQPTPGDEVVPGDDATNDGVSPDSDTEPAGSDATETATREDDELSETGSDSSATLLGAGTLLTLGLALALLARKRQGSSVQ